MIVAVKKTALGEDRVVPTSYQIGSGHIVVPKTFYQRNIGAIDWGRSFTVVAFGETLVAKRIDYDRRLTIRLKDKITDGQVLRLSIRDNALVIEKAES